MRVITLGSPRQGIQQTIIVFNPSAVEFPGQNTLRPNADNSCACGLTMQTPWYSGRLVVMVVV